MKSINASRRVFLRTSSLLGALVPTAAPFALNLAAMGSAAAQSASDYRALVCLFMFGGNDSGNMVVATDPSSWDEYTRMRTGGMRLGMPGSDNGLLPINAATPQAGRSFALHPSMIDAKASFDAGNTAIIANVGPLIVPTTRAEYRDRSVPLPPNLFSHNDQQSTWQTHLPEGAQYGWGGRMGDLLASMNQIGTFTCISASGNAVWVSGENTVQFRVNANGSSAIGGLDGSLFGSSRGSSDFRYFLTRPHANLLEESHASVTRRSLDAQALLNESMLPVDAVDPVPTLPNGQANGVARQLQTVARIIGARSALGVRRQVFFVSFGGFDTHSNQPGTHANLMAQLSQALAYFNQVMASPQVNAANEATLFTASDFGRTLTSNGDGTDHGWGAHHFISGGAVRGGDIYGRFPSTAQDNDDYVGNGRLLPELSVDQYGGTLARWFGVSESELDDIFPSLGNFGSRDLGFMRT
ncbi:MAG: DUF1501 domain-containing protein [Burkholderiaceae bacterium]|jgi:uncharacterized protein (DUF1501 family)|nr:DUF1501 domain-containing protein [Gemmatimonadales bacterium]MCO5119935.1 DUF1501 domain-containing protein [Burkholderiaceae bacterium]MEB2318816.1 DUF1501 domain-containing protein [Pseudomonadota bacterium]